MASLLQCQRIGCFQRLFETSAFVLGKESNVEVHTFSSFLRSWLRFWPQSCAATKATVLDKIDLKLDPVVDAASEKSTISAALRSQLRRQLIGQMCIRVRNHRCLLDPRGESGISCLPILWKVCSRLYRKKYKGCAERIAPIGTLSQNGSKPFFATKYNFYSMF